MPEHTISIIVNTTDRAKSLQTLLRTLEHQSYPHFELIVVVGPTHDNTLEILEPYQDRIRLYRCAEANLSKSRNIGLLAARGDIVAYIDDDAVPSYHWLAQLNRLFQDDKLAGTGGKVYMVHPNQPVVQHRIGIASSLAEQYDVRTSWLDGLVPPGRGKLWSGRMMGTNMAYRRQDLLDINGFDEFFEWLYDDSDIGMRLTQAGKIVHPVQEAVVYHTPASSRNRVAHSYSARWWVQTKSVIYFIMHFGPGAGETRRDLMMRALHFAHGHWLWSADLYHDGRLSRRQFWKMRREEVKSSLIGLYYSLSKSRSLIDESEIANVMEQNEPILPFITDNFQQGAVDPITGRRPQITIPEQPLRICLLSASYPPEQFEGVGRLTNLMAQGLFECGHTVHVITRGEKDSVSFYDGAYVHQVPSGNRYGRYQMLPKLYASLNHSHAVHEKVNQLILNDGIQIVDSPLWQYDGLVTAISQQIPVVVRLLTALRQIAALQNDQDIDSRLVGEMEQTLLERATHLLPNTQATMDNAQKVYSLSLTPERYTIVPYGIVPVLDEEIRPFNLQNPPETLTVLYVGRLEKRKGIQDLFAAIPAILQQVPNAHFIIAGSDNSHRDGFQQQTGMDYPAYFGRHHATYKDNVTFLGYVSEEKLQELYQSCDLFVAPSLYESFGLIYLEAMNYAKPVIGCRAGGIPEVVEDQVCGLLVDPSSPAELAAATIKLLRSPQLLHDMGLASRQHLLDKFTHIQMAQAFAAVYKQTIEKQARILASKRKT